MEYVTGAEAIGVFDAIVVHILNTGDLYGSARLLIYQNTGSGAAVFVDTGELAIPPSSVESVGVSALANGLCWLKICVSSKELVATASFTAQQGGQRMTLSYSPADFAVFDRVLRAAE